MPFGSGPIDVLKAGFNPSKYFGYKVGHRYHAHFKYLISVDGHGCAFARVPMIMHSNSLLLKNRSTKWQWFYSMLKDKENMVYVKEDLSDLLDVYYWCETH